MSVLGPLARKVKSHSVQNFISGIVYQGAIAISGIIMPRLIISHYGSVINGLISTITQIVSYLTIMEMGLTSASLVALYEPMARQDYRMAGHIIAAIQNFYKEVAMLFLGGTVVCGVFLTIFIKDDISVWVVWLMLAAVSGVNLVTYMFIGKYRAILQADNRLYVSNYVRSIGVIVQFLMGLFIVLSNWNVALIKFVAVLTCGIEAVFLYRYCGSIYPNINMNDTPAFGAIKQRKDIMIHQVSALVLNNTDIILLTVIGSTLAHVSVYSVYNMIMMLLLHVATSFLGAKTAAFGKMYALGRINQLREDIRGFEKWYYLIVFWLFTSMAILIMPFIRLYTKGISDTIYDYPVLGLLFSVIGICRIIRGNYSEIINAAGKFKDTREISINSAWINLALSLVLIWKYQIPGILIGTIVAEIYRTIHCMVYFQKHLFRFDWITSLSRLSLNSLLFLVLYIVAAKIRCETYDGYVSAFVSMSLVSGVIFLVMICANEALDIIISRIISHKRVAI